MSNQPYQQPLCKICHTHIDPQYGCKCKPKRCMCELSIFDYHDNPCCVHMLGAAA